MNFSLKGGSFPLALILATFGTTDKFAKENPGLYPEFITSASCNVAMVDLDPMQGGERRDVWEAHAIATQLIEQGKTERWAKTLAEYPATSENLRKAQHVCDDWTYEVQKRIQKARVNANKLRKEGK